MDFPMSLAKLQIAGLWALAFLAVGCAKTKISMYDAVKLDQIKTWHLGFKFEAGRYEQTIGTSDGQETKLIKEGYPPVDLQFRDDLFFRLRDKFRIMTVQDESTADGFIKINPVHFTAGGYKSLDVQLYDRQNKLLARLRMNNGQRSATIQDNEKFARFCADAIGRAVTEPYLQ